MIIKKNFILFILLLAACSELQEKKITPKSDAVESEQGHGNENNKDNTKVDDDDDAVQLITPEFITTMQNTGDLTEEKWSEYIFQEMTTWQSYSSTSIVNTTYRNEELFEETYENTLEVIINPKQIHSTTISFTNHYYHEFYANEMDGYYGLDYYGSSDWYHDNQVVTEDLNDPLPQYHHFLSIFFIYRENFNVIEENETSKILTIWLERPASEANTKLSEALSNLLSADYTGGEAFIQSVESARVNILIKNNRIERITTTVDFENILGEKGTLNVENMYKLVNIMKRIEIPKKVLIHAKNNAF